MPDNVAIDAEEAPAAAPAAAAVEPTKKQLSRWRFVQRTLVTHFLMRKLRQRIPRTSFAGIAAQLLNVRSAKMRYSEAELDELWRRVPPSSQRSIFKRASGAQATPTRRLPPRQRAQPAMMVLSGGVVV